MLHRARTLCRHKAVWARVRDLDGILEKVCLGRNFGSRPNPSSIRNEDSNGMLGVWKFQIKV